MLESVPAGTVLHAIGEEGVQIRDVAETIAKGLGVDAVSVTQADASEFVGWLCRFWGTDGRASSHLTRTLTGWQSTGPGLVEDLNVGHSFT